MLTAVPVVLGSLLRVPVGEGTLTRSPIVYRAKRGATTRTALR